MDKTKYHDKNTASSSQREASPWRRETPKSLQQAGHNNTPSSYWKPLSNGFVCSVGWAKKIALFVGSGVERWRWCVQLKCVSVATDENNSHVRSTLPLYVKRVFPALLAVALWFLWESPKSRLQRHCSWHLCYLLVWLSGSFPAVWTRAKSQWRSLARTEPPRR